MFAYFQAVQVLRVGSAQADSLRVFNIINTLTEYCSELLRCMDLAGTSLLLLSECRGKLFCQHLRK